MASGLDIGDAQFVGDKLDGSLVSFFRAPEAPIGYQREGFEGAKCFSIFTIWPGILE